MTNIPQLTETLSNHPDPIERFLALYDLYRFLQTGKGNVAQVTQIAAAMTRAAKRDPEYHLRQWAAYYHDRVMGRATAKEEPFLPAKWKLFIVE